MRARDRLVAWLVGATLLAIAAPGWADIDITGRWGVIIDSFFLGPTASEWDIQQTGTSLAVTITFTNPNGLGATYSGSIDPITGMFTVDLPDDPGYPPYFPSCGDSRIDGIATPDALAISGTYTALFFKETPILFGCNDGGGPFEGQRCGPGVEACCAGPSCCGNGVVSGGEECDDGNQLDGDCCSATCTFEPAAAPCSDSNVCTDDTLGCDGAGSCQHAFNTAPCGTTCRPGTCSAGSCVSAAAPAGTTCDDHNACTAGDQCNGSGSCVSGSAVACTEPCQSCIVSTGCVALPHRTDQCDSLASSALTLSVANPARAKVTWQREDDAGNPALAGDPTATAKYELCVFDAAGLLFGAAVAPAGTCDGKPCWQRTTTGYRYRDASGSSGGVKKLLLGETAPSFDLKMKAKGSGILPPSLAGVAAPVIAELRASTPSGNRCWLSYFDASAIKSRTKTLRAND